MWSTLLSSRDPILEVLSIVTVTSTCIWLTTSFVVAIWRRESAATRHRLWGLSMLAVIAAPVLILAIPIPQWARFDLSSLRQAQTIARQSKVADETPFAESIDHEGVRRMTIEDFFRSLLTPRSLAESDIEQPTRESDLETRPFVAGSPVIATGRASVRLPVDILKIIGWVWLTGMILAVLLLAASIRRVTTWVQRAIPLNSGREVTRCTELCDELMIRRPLRIVVSAETIVPFVAGTWRPIVVLPAGFGKWTPERLSVVLAHELMHVQRNDVFWQLVSQVCLIINWFNPLGWIVARQLRVECEYACDDAVLRSGNAASEYANHLLEIASWIQSRTRPVPCIVAMASNSHVEKRIRSILDPTQSRHPVDRRRTSIAMSFMAIVVILIAAITPVHSESKPTDSTVTDAVTAPEKAPSGSPSDVPTTNEGRTDKPVTSLNVESKNPHAETRIRFMIPSVERVQDDLEWLINLSPTPELRKQSVVLKKELIEALTQGVELTMPIAMDLVLREREILTEFRVPISKLKGNDGFLSALKGIGYRVKTIHDGTSYELSEKNQKPFYLRVDQDFVWISGTLFPPELPAATADLKPLLALEQDFVLNLENDPAGMAARQASFKAFRSELQSLVKLRRNEDPKALELRKSVLDWRFAEVERLVVQAKEFRVGWSTSTDTETQFGRGEFLLTALPQTELQDHIQKFATTTSSFVNVKRHANPIVSLNLNLPLDSPGVAACTRHFELLRPFAESQIQSKADLTDAQREAFVQVTHKLLELMDAGLKTGHIDAFFELFSLADQKNAMVCGIRTPNGKAVDEIIELLPRVNSEWQIKLDLQEYHGVRVHELTIPNAFLSSFQSVFGDRSVFYVGIAKDTVWVAAGVVALKHLETAIDEAAGPSPKMIDPVAISYQMELRTLTSLLQAIHQEHVLWPVPQTRKERAMTQHYLKLLQDSMDDRNSLMKGELRRTGNQIEGFLEFNANGLKPIGTVIADGVKSVQ